MAKEKYSFSWRTAPRSIQVLLEWLPFFYDFQGESRDEKINGQYELRRKLRWTFETKKDEPDREVTDVPFWDFVGGQQFGTKDKESLVRQQYTTAEQFGFLGVRGETRALFVTEAGRRIVEKTFTPEDFLVQLIKMYVITNKEEEGIFPFKVFIQLLDEFNYLSRYELTYLFAATTPTKLTDVKRAITTFREKYQDRSLIPNRNDNKKVEKLLKETWETYFGVGTFLNSWGDYTDAFLRAITYTDMFDRSGRGAHAKVRVRPLFQSKFNLLVSPQFKFEKPPKKKVKGKWVDVASRDDITWFGAIGNIELPWDNFSERKNLVSESITLAKSEFAGTDAVSEIKKYEAELGSMKSITRLKDIERELSQKLLIKNEEHFINVVSKTAASKAEILNRFEIILKDNDMSALWLEVNTWKALVSIEGNQKVVPNFKMEQDLTPRSFAPGLGNTPDMELYTDKYVIIPEVSLMTGKVQWEHEGSSVIDHVLGKAKEHPDKKTLGLFISSSINERTLWQFFVLSKTSWLGQPIPVIPLTITQFTQVIEHLFETGKDIDHFISLIEAWGNKALTLANFEDWKQAIHHELQCFINVPA